MKEKCKIISVFLTGVILLNMGVSLSEIQAKAESISAELLCDGTTISYSSEKKQEAWNEANRKKNAVLKLYEDWTIDSNLTAVSEAEFTLDLNGHILKRSLTDYQDEGHLITLEENAKLSIVDSMPDAVHENYAIKGGILTGGKSGDTAGCIELEEHSVLNLKGCSIIGCSTQQDGGAIRMDYVCELNIQDTGFYVNFTADSNNNCHGGAIYIGDGTATIQNASFEGNYSEDNAGAIYINDGGLSVSKSIFRGNYAKDYGGAVYVDNSYNPVLFSGCTFMENTAEDNGGAVYIDECNQTVFNNCYFSRNTAWDQGGALFIDDDNTAVVSTTITNNTSGNDGSGVYIDGSHIFGIQGKVIIRDNYQTNGSSNNLYLDTSWVGSPSTLTNGGLYDGSDIYLSSTASGRTLIAENFSEFQKIQFLHAETGSLEIDKDTVEKQAERFLASVIGNQNMLVIGIGILMFLIYIIVIIVKNKKMKGMDNRENKA